MNVPKQVREDFKLRSLRCCPQAEEKLRYRWRPRRLKTTSKYVRNDGKLLYYRLHDELEIGPEVRYGREDADLRQGKAGN